MRYRIHFDAELPAADLRAFLLTEYGVAPGADYLGRIEDQTVDDARPVAMLTPPEGDEGFGWIHRWVLVSADGSSGRVLTAADGDLRIVCALEPISGEPQLAVVPPPDWARDW
ncbi:hypothetical protein ACFYON_24710 [Micromonospora sp. NPDC005686]|uniref:hypothetical protein n=1 Tax=Micromonospora sp. NPDC005686 TaxID=3364233 RepID=UPI0036C0A7F7